MKRIILIALLAALASTTLVAQVDIPLRNWTVPPYTASSSGGITTMVDATPPRLFIGLPPCRLLDTRPPVSNPLDGDGAYFANEVRSYTLTGSCGIPIGTDAVSLNITVTNTGAHPFGFIKIWPQGGVEPNVSTLNWATGGVTVANAAIVPLSAGGGISVRSGNAGSDVIIDVNGYFSDTLGTPGNYLYLTNNSGLWTAAFNNDSTTCGGPCGLVATVNSGWAIYGVSSETTADVNYGVWGSVNSTGAGSAGVYGLANNASGQTYGVFGDSDSTGNDAAGVFGLGQSGYYGGPRNLASNIGVFGESATGYGIVGQSANTAGIFYHRNAAGTTLHAAWVASSIGAGYAFYASTGAYGGTGGKYFVEPHPDDANKIIRYVSLEGPESGTYFRGRARFQNGLAVIDVPEDFRIVTDEEGLSIQVTPIGQMATVAVENIGLDRIVVRGSRNVEFFYLVNGVRRALKDHRPITEAENGGEFMPLSADWTMPEYPAELKRRLIRNGTYKEDGTVNMETAQRLGWDRVWERDRPTPTPQPE